MAEVLSQSQIDALLSAARSGEMDLSASAEKSQEKKYRKYDFYSPRKFTKDHIKILNGIFENYTRMLISRLNGVLHTSCEVTVETIEEQRYYEFSNALSEGDVLTIVDVDSEGEDISGEQPTLLHFSTTLMLSMMDRLMGGEGDVDTKLPDEYNLTDLEIRLYESLAKGIVSIMGTSWENYTELKFKLRRIETNPTLVQLIGVDETVVIIGIKIEFPNCSGQMSVCLPGVLLSNFFNIISLGMQTGRKQGQDHSHEIMNILKESDLEIVAELGRTELHLKDAYFLQVGDVIDLGHSVDTPVQLYIGGRPWFGGKMGTSNNNMAVRIGEVYHDEERGDDEGL